jgi:valyl-tRNA synthetase
VEGGGEVVVATTRPETMLGDTAVAVHPDDERYQALVGRRVTLPLTGRTIPVIADAFVDPKFGTGVVKVTPAHDPNDFEAGKRNGLGLVTVIGFDGKMTKAAGEAYAGQDRAEARKKVLRDLDALGLRRGEKSHVLPLARCQRSDTVVEPLVSIQWFVKIAPLAEKAVVATENRETAFTPDLWKKTYDEWMKNIRDWCISRQLWWGHEIPAWYCADGHVSVPKPGAPDPAACATCGKKDLTRDPDVFDTWFSSWLMPLSVFGWPEKTADFERFYPTSVLVTGFDILFFWVARMVMAGVWFDGRAPFKDVVLHGLVRDEKGQKMSKTKGNVVDPLEMCDEFGADAVRFTLAVLSGTGRDLPFGKARVAGYRAFATKVWNAARFALPLISEGECADVGALDFRSLSTVDRWILARLSDAAGRVSASLEAYRFDEAAHALYQFFWSEFCDGYVEMIKPVLRGDAPEAEKAQTRGVLKRVLLDSLALLHPFMPFVSCEIREALNGDGLELTMTKFPEPRAEWRDDAAVTVVELVRAIVTRVRNLRAERGLPQTEALRLGIELAPGPLSEEMRRHVPLLSHLARLSAVEISSKVNWPGAHRDVVSDAGIVVELPKKEISPEDEEKIRKEIEKLGTEAEKIRARLADDGFLSRAPAAVVAKTKQQHEEISERQKRLAGNLVGTSSP